MITWVIRACERSRYVSEVFVSTEDAEIAAIARGAGAVVIDRPAELAGEEVYKHDAVANALDQIERLGARPDVVLSVQPNSPELTSEMLDAGIDLLYRHDLWEVFSVSPELIQNGAFRVLRQRAARLRTLSVHCAVIIADVTDVHTVADVARVELRLRSREGA